MLPAFHPGQIQVHQTAKRFNVLACGRRWGKTKFGIAKATEPALGGIPVGWFAPAYKYLKEPWRELKRLLAPVTVKASETDKFIELVTGGRIDFWTLDDADAGRSYKYGRIIADEAAMVKHLGEWWNEAGRPTLADYQGDAWFLSTPKGRNYFWQLWGRDDPEFASWQMPTSVNPYISAVEIEAARKETPELAFRQEWLAEFIDEVGGVFRGIYDVIDLGRDAPEAARPERRYVMGVDLARYQDWTVLSVFDDTGRQVALIRFNQISWERQVATIREMADRYRASVLIDSTGVGDPIYERLRSLGVSIQPYQFTAASKEALINNLAMAIEQQTIRLMDVQAQANELMAYEYEQTAAGRLKMNAPSGMHDDIVIADALAVWQLQRRRSVDITFA